MYVLAQAGHRARESCQRRESPLPGTVTVSELAGCKQTSATEFASSSLQLESARNGDDTGHGMEEGRFVSYFTEKESQARQGQTIVIDWESLPCAAGCGGGGGLGRLFREGPSVGRL